MRKQSGLIKFFPVFIFIMFSPALKAFELKGGDSLPTAEKIYKNVVRYNISNPSFFDIRTIILGYERMIKENRSISVNMGQILMPKYTIFYPDSNSTRNDIVITDKGFNFSVDYRFYFPTLNKKAAPIGFYIGPFYSYNYMNRKNSWTYNSANFNGPVNNEYTINAHMLGCEIGYQVLFLKRFTFDMIMFAPSFAYYSVNTSIDPNMEPSSKAEFIGKVYDAIANKLPGYSNVIGNDFKRTGSYTTFTTTYRVLFHIGYIF